MKLKLYQVDSFTDKLFGGNPAAVCPLSNWLEDEMMQNIAAENNLSETAFVVNEDENYRIRWFTPTVEVDLCGHATLAAAYVFFRLLKIKQDNIVFKSLSGNLEVSINEELLTMNFPARKPVKVEYTDMHKICLNIEPEEVFFNNKLMFVLKNEKEVKNAQPNFEAISKIESDGLIITAEGDEVDFVSRYFAPHAGIPEDPVTGSAHTVLTPFWSKRLSKKNLTARQLSKRGGYLLCEDLDSRVNISGRAVLYSEADIFV